MKPHIDCPVCNGKASLQAEIKKRTYRGDDFEVCEHFYKCSKCDYAFTDKEVDAYNINLVHNKYREKYNIPSPEQLIFVRESYGLSQTKMSEILGFGSNQYRLYESGDIPVGGNATVLSLIINPKEFKTILEKKKDMLPGRQYTNIVNNIEKLIDGDLTSDLKQALFPINVVPNSLSGFKIPSFSKLANMVIYFLSEAKFKTKLNKLLFYADFAHFKYFGNSISGCEYAAIDMGPVPHNFKLIFGLLEQENYLFADITTVYDKETEMFFPLQSFDANLFNKDELETLSLVLSKFGQVKTSALIKTSHNEIGWIENEETKRSIDYSIYAPQLKAI